MRHQLSIQKGFSLVELLIALVVSTVLILGISTAYTSIVTLVNTSKNLENAQEVLRYCAEVFTRSLTNTSDGTVLVTGNVNQLNVNQKAGSIACDGSKPTASYTEKFAIDGNNLTCELVDENGGGEGPKIILTGIESITFAKNEQLVSVTVTPQALFGEPAGTGPTKPVQIDIALKEIILINAMNTTNTGP